MHQIGWLVMFSMATLFHNELRESFGPSFMRHKWEIPFLIGNILMVMDEAKGDSGSSLVDYTAGHFFDEFEARGTTDECLSLMDSYAALHPTLALTAWTMDLNWSMKVVEF